MDNINKQDKRKYTYDEGYEASLKYFEGDELAASTWIKKYCLSDDDGYYGVTVEYVNVNLRENKGSYIVTIDEFEPIPIENTSENRPYLVAPFEG